MRPSLQIVGQDLLDPWDSTSKYAASRPTGHYLPGWSRCLLFKQDCPGDHSGDDETFLVCSAQSWLHMRKSACREREAEYFADCKQDYLCILFFLEVWVSPICELFTSYKSAPLSCTSLCVLHIAQGLHNCTYTAWVLHVMARYCDYWSVLQRRITTLLFVPLRTLSTKNVPQK